MIDLTFEQWDLLTELVQGERDKASRYEVPEHVSVWDNLLDALGQRATPTDTEDAK